MAGTPLRNPKAHPQLPFIQIGRHVEWGSVDSDGTPIPSEINEWTYLIDGWFSGGVFRDEQHAIDHAEKTLFTEQLKVVQKYVDLAIERQDFQLAMAIAERKGYWAGVADHRRSVAKIIQKVQSTLDPLGRAR